LESLPAAPTTRVGAVTAVDLINEAIDAYATGGVEASSRVFQDASEALQAAGLGEP
jgi:hypothetical protein